MKKIFVIILVAFCAVGVISRTLSLSNEQDENSSEHEEDNLHEDDENTNVDEENSNESDDDDDDESEADENVKMSLEEYRKKHLKDKKTKVPKIDSKYVPKNSKDYIRKSNKNPETGKGDIKKNKKSKNDDDDDENSSEKSDESDEGGTGWEDEVYRWPKSNGKVIIPYEIDSGIPYLDEHIRNMKQAMERLETETGCVEFKPRTNQADYLFITREREDCSSYVGKIGGKQDINFGFECVEEIGSMVHEFIHALGFFHMQSHPFRDLYVMIDYNNIDPQYVHNFDLLPAQTTSSFNTPYDYFSIMHYGPYYSSFNGFPTIIPMDPGMDMFIGQRNLMSIGDIVRIQRMYQCTEMFADENDDSDSKEDNNESDNDKNESDDDDDNDDE